jgi:hypothetical protein
MPEDSEAPGVLKVKRNHIMAAKLKIELYERVAGEESPVD